MTSTDRITFVSAVNNREILNEHLLASPCFRAPHNHQILIQEGFPSAAQAYNDAIQKSVNELIVFCHQDIYLPSPWLSQLQKALDQLESQDPNWGVLGCGGMTRDGLGRGHLYSSGLGILGEPFERPALVQTLDEIVLIVRKSSGLGFDPELPHFHLYGTDICLAAARRGRASYAISAFCIHNTHQGLILPKEFYECCAHVRRVWRDSLPVVTPCIRLTKSNYPVYRRRLHEFYLKHIRRKTVAAVRVGDVPKLVEEVLRATTREKLA
jgi:glycosyltransferase involved in cell wall biosynthesis